VGVTAATGQMYAQGLGRVWPRVQRALAELDAIAADPDDLADGDLVGRLTHLQYDLHLGSEHIYGLEPPPGAESAHAELAEALACARDETAEAVDALVERGTAGLGPLLDDWRGALFRVRLARMRLATPPLEPHAALELVPEGNIRPLIAFLLALGGAVAFAGGAGGGLWPVWGAGLVAVCAAVACYRPRR
jgi:hypothetical protein